MRRAAALATLALALALPAGAQAHRHRSAMDRCLADQRNQWIVYWSGPRHRWRGVCERLGGDFHQIEVELEVSIPL